jgi:hypothetical protein
MLQEWKVSEPLPPRFAERVWHRIERDTQGKAARRSPADVLAWLRLAIVRPTLAAGYLSILLLAGAGAGFWQAHLANERTVQTLEVRYLQLMDPYRMPR